MKSHPTSVADAGRIVRQWHETGRVLAEFRRNALVSQSAEESRQAAFDMLDLGGQLPDDPRRERMFGLIEMQRLFAVLRERGGN